MLVFSRYVLHKVTYKVETTSKRERTLYLTHRFQQGYTLHETPAPEERTDSSYRFKIEVPAGGTLQFPVVERGEQQESFHLQQITSHQLEVWVAQKDLSKSLRTSLESVGAGQRAARRGAGHDARAGRKRCRL